MKHSKKKTETVEIETLSPVVAKEYEKPVSAIKDGLKKGATNIGITCPYGGGKSSLIETLLQDKKLSKKAVKVSFADLFERTKPESREYVEKSLVQQLLFSCKPQKVKGSRIFRAKDNHNWLKTLVFGLGLFLLFIGVAFAFVSINSESFAQVISDEALRDCFVRVAPMWPFIVAFLAAISIALIFGSVKSLVFKAQNVEIEITKDKDTNYNGDDSLLSKYFDELVYYFKKSKNRIVILEDLDRPSKFDTNVFVDFRQLNISLNSAEELKSNWIKRFFCSLFRLKKKDKISFVYCLDDKIFKKVATMQKFFDLVIPVMPIINSQNCITKLKEKMSGIDDLRRYVIENQTDMRFLPALANYVKDMRVLISSLNEYRLVYAGKTGVDGCSEKEEKEVKRNLLLCFYHNLYPEAYERLFCEQNDYRDAIKEIEKNKEEYRKRLLTSLDEMAKKKTIANPIRVPEKYRLMLNSYISQYGSYCDLYHSKNTPTIDQVESFQNKDLEIKCFTDRYGSDAKKMRIGDLEHGLNANLYEEIEKPLRQSVVAADKEYNNLKKEIDNLPKNPIEFAKRYPEEAFSEEKDDEAASFVKRMITYGYFDDSLLDALLSKSESGIQGSTSFIKRSLIEKNDITLESVLNPFEVCVTLDDYFFEEPSIINADIIETLFTEASVIEGGDKKKRSVEKVLRDCSSVVSRKRHKLICADYSTHQKMLEFLLERPDYLISCLEDPAISQDDKNDRMYAIEQIILSSSLNISNQERLPEVIKQVWTTDYYINSLEASRLITFAKDFERSGVMYPDIGFADNVTEVISFLSASNAWELNLGNIKVLLGKANEKIDYEEALKELERNEKLKNPDKALESIKIRLADNEIQVRLLFIENDPESDASKESMKKVLELAEEYDELPLLSGLLKRCLKKMDWKEPLSPKLGQLLGINKDSPQE